MVALHHQTACGGISALCQWDFIWHGAVSMVIIPGQLKRDVMNPGWFLRTWDS